MTLRAFVFRKLRTRKTRLDKSLKSPVADDSSRINMADVRKHCGNLHHRFFNIFFDNCQGHWVGKSLSSWHAKSLDCLLTHWMPMTSILFLIIAISRYQFRCNYLWKKKFSSIFFCFLKSSWNSKPFEKKHDPHSFCISEITDSENVVR